MNQAKQPSQRSSAEKRALWEIRQRYRVTPPAPNQSGSRRIPGTPPPRPPRRPATQHPARRPGRQPHKHSLAKRLTAVIFALLVLSGGVFGYKILAAGNKISVADRSLLGQLKDLLLSSGDALEGEQMGRINILLLAIGGEGHSGENLADTIIVASIRPEDNRIALLSIPRDLYVQVPGEEYFTKINAVHSYGESQKKDNGPVALRQVVEEITGQPIHYFARADFTAFKHIVDAVGGVNITIENSFFDYWHKIAFPAGTEKMNGERALAYVRARYIEGSEGGDFKRASRQQQILLALREKVFSVQTALDFSALNQILNSLSDNIRTDMHLWEMKRFYELARNIDGQQVRSIVLSTGHNGVLVGSTEVLGGTPASVLRPRTGDYSEIQTLVANIFEAEAVATALPDQLVAEENAPEEAEASEEAVAKPKLEIRNGTNTTGLAGTTGEKLKAEGYEVVAVGNAQNRSTEKTTVYALKGDYTDAAKELAASLNAQTDSGLPKGEAESQADVLIILGTDANKES